MYSIMAWRFPVWYFLMSFSIGGPEGPFGRVGLSLPHLVSDVSDPQLIKAPRAPSAGLSLPHLISNFSGLLLIRATRAPSAGLSLPHLISNYSGPQLSDFLSWPSYIIVQRPLNLWNGMFDRHQAEITVMQFTGHSLPVHQSMSVPWDFLPCPISSANPAFAISSHNCHWNVSLPSGASLWNGKFGCVEGQNTTVVWKLTHSYQIAIIFFLYLLCEWLLLK